MSQSQKNFIFAVLTFLLGVLFLQFMGVIIKFIGSTYPSLQLTFFRNFFGIFPIIIFIYISKNLKNKSLLVKIPMLWVAILRGFLMTFAQFCFFVSRNFKFFNLINHEIWINIRGCFMKMCCKLYCICK